MPVSIREFSEDDLSWLTAAHGTLYAEAEGFDSSFEMLVQEILHDYVANHDPTCERGWIAEEDGTRLGSIFCVRLDAETAKLRLFLLIPEARGRGLGRAMLAQCTGFARGVGYARMALWTHESHRAACALYARTGWTCQWSKPVHSFGQNLIEQHWQITL